MNENNSSRNRIVLIAAVAVIALCLVAAVSAAIGGVAGFAIGRNRQTIEIQRTLTPDDSRRPNQQTPIPGLPYVPVMPDDQMPMGPGVMGMNGAMIREVVADGPAAHLHTGRKVLLVNRGHQRLVAFTKRVRGGKRQRDLVTGFLAVQGFFYLGEDVVIATVQVDHGLAAGVERLAGGVRHFEVQGDGGVFVDFHGMTG